STPCKFQCLFYKEWIATQTSLYDHLVTSAHSQMARYYLSKIFRWTYEIDIVYFNPDEYNARYVNPTTDYWFAISSWDEIYSATKKQNSSASRIPIVIPRSVPYSDKVLDCKWVVRVEEDFNRDDSNYQYQDYMGEHLAEVSNVPAKSFRKHRSNIYSKILDVYDNQTVSNSPNISDTEQLVLKISNATPKSV
ncbi:MAG: hypothetical protein AAFY41_12730, partial [Bacteroidota bacterium]